MKLNPQCKVRNVAGLNVLVHTGQLNVDTTKIVVLNDLALGLWNKFRDVDFTAEIVADYLVSEYGVSLELATKDSSKWIHALRDALLLYD